MKLTSKLISSTRADRLRWSCWKMAKYTKWEILRCYLCWLVVGDVCGMRGIVLMSFKSWFQCQAYGGMIQSEAKLRHHDLEIQYKWRRAEHSREKHEDDFCGNSKIFHIMLFLFSSLLLYDDFKHVKILFHYVWMRHVLNMFFSSHHVWGKYEQRQQHTRENGVGWSWESSNLILVAAAASYRIRTMKEEHSSSSSSSRGDWMWKSGI